MNKTIVWVIAGVLVVGAAMYFLSQKPSTDTVIINTATTTQNGTAVSGNTQGQGTSTPDNFVVLEETEASKSVTIESVRLSQLGYIVIYRINANNETEIIGHSNLLNVGVQSNIKIQLDSAIIKEQTIVAVLHLDDGDGKFEFPGADSYLGEDGAEVTSDVDIVDVASDKEPALLRTQMKDYFKRTN